VSRYKVDREQVTSQGIQSYIAFTGAVAVLAITNVSKGSSRSKNHDEPINFIVRVISRFLNLVVRAVSGHHESALVAPVPLFLSTWNFYYFLILNNPAPIP
jgi:hypothetical protein